MEPVTLTITISEQGCSVNGPLQDKMTCYGMLELARDAVRNFGEKAENGKSPLIVSASPNLRIT